ncbi:TPA: CDP-glycerol glycerophosphotransferase family protein, partial [Proteus mirabilis]|nr:CDP-glycerol glycerophosphotransferase family protein [Proteus mirabilis]
NFISHDVEDMIEFYSDYDCLITDYSSACFEYAPIGGKVIFFTPDLEKYTNQRGFTINYNELTQGKNTNNTNELKVAIMRAKNNNEYSLDYKKYVGVSDNCMELIYVKFNR